MAAYQSPCWPPGSISPHPSLILAPATGLPHNHPPVSLFPHQSPAFSLCSILTICHSPFSCQYIALATPSRFPFLSALDSSRCFWMFSLIHNKKNLNYTMEQGCWQFLCCAPLQTSVFLQVDRECSNSHPVSSSCPTLRTD